MAELLFPTLLNELPGVVAAFTTRRGGVSTAPHASLNMSISTGDSRPDVEENRRRALAKLSLQPDQMAVAGQVHGVRVRRVSAPGFYPETDGLVTTEPGVVLSLTAADCAAVLLADISAGVIAGAHAGWRGAAAGIIGNTVRTMQEAGAEAARIRAYVSPCISVANFEVGEEVARKFDEDLVRRPEGRPRPFVDLKAHLKRELTAAGVHKQLIEVDARCTVAGTETFFSHRAENGKTGRMMALLALRDER